MRACDRPALHYSLDAAHCAFFCLPAVLKLCFGWNLRLQHRQNDSGSISRIENKENPMNTNEIDPPRVALVTGAGTGIGRAVALEFLAQGYRVVLAGRRREPLEATRTAAGEDGVRALVVPTDVSDEQAVRDLFDTAQREYGRLDVLFNNAGRGAPAVPIEELPVAVWRDVVDTNLTGMFLCAQAAIRVMKAQTPRGGRIINNGSISSHAPRPFSIAYTATKHAVTGLTKSISLDCRPYNIACGQIDIGNAATDMTERMAAGILQADGSTKVEPRMDVAHVAQAVAAMARLPLEANVQFMTIMATNMPFVGRG
jgi:NAD(P)-dependent dehydrogenase (short-subunit alcohol dehydrogenase family)